MINSVRTTFVLALLPMLLACGADSRAPGGSDPLARTDGWTFVNYWAKWCKPCIREIPELNALHARDGVRVLGVNYDGAVGDALQQQLDDLGVAFPTLPADPAARFGIERPQVLPTTLVIAPGGELTKVLVGPQTEAGLLALTGLATGPGVDADPPPAGVSSGN